MADAVAVFLSLSPRAMHNITSPPSLASGGYEDATENFLEGVQALDPSVGRSRGAPNTWGEGGL